MTCDTIPPYQPLASHHLPFIREARSDSRVSGVIDIIYRDCRDCRDRLLRIPTKVGLLRERYKNLILRVLRTITPSS